MYVSRWVSYRLFPEGLQNGGASLKWSVAGGSTVGGARAVVAVKTKEVAKEKDLVSLAYP